LIAILKLIKRRLLEFDTAGFLEYLKGSFKMDDRIYY